MSYKYLDLTGLSHFWDKIKAKIPTKVSQLTNDSGYTTNTGTVTSVAVKMNNTTKGTVITSGTIDLGTVITAHQDISGKQDKLTAGSNIQITNNTISATDTTYSSKTAASGGTAVSLVTTGEKYTWNNKQNALSSQTAYSAKGSATKVPQITTNSLGQVTGITEVTITQPTVNNGTLTIQKNGASVGTFTANQSGNSTANITVPTKTTDLTNDSGFIESEDETVANIVSLTKEEYDALDTKTPNTLYNIIDDYDDVLEDFTSKVTFNESYANASFKLKNGVVYIHYNGELKAHADGILLFTIPDGYRPPISIFTPFVQAPVYGRVWFDVGGNVYISSISSTTSTTRVSFSISYVLS